MPTDARDEAYWRDLHGHFKLNDSLRFLNNGTTSLTSNPNQETCASVDHQIALDSSDPSWTGRIEDVFRQLPLFVRADELFFTHSVTEGMNIIAYGADWKPGDKVILAQDEHHGGSHAYLTLEKRYGISTCLVHLPLLSATPEVIVNLRREAISERSRLIVLSHVFYTDGVQAPIASLAALVHEHDLLISVDGEQSFDVLFIDLYALGVDHHAGSGQKWLLSGTGMGFTFIQRVLQKTISPLFGYDNPAQKLPLSSRRCEGFDLRNTPSLRGIGAALQMQQESCIMAIEQRTRQLAKQLPHGMRSISAPRICTPDEEKPSATLTIFSLRGVTPEVLVALWYWKAESSSARSLTATGKRCSPQHTSTNHLRKLSFCWLPGGGLQKSRRNKNHDLSCRVGSITDERQLCRPKPSSC